MNGVYSTERFTQLAALFGLAAGLDGWARVRSVGFPLLVISASCPGISLILWSLVLTIFFEVLAS